MTASRRTLRKSPCVTKKIGSSLKSRYSGPDQGSIRGQGFKMQNRWRAWILTVAAALSFSPALWTQTSARPEAATNTPDLSGMWVQAPARLPGRFSAEDAPLQPWAQEVYKVNRQGVTDPRQSGL